MITRIFKTIGVMGDGKRDWAEYAAPLGEALGAWPVNLLTGGGRGTMTAVSQAFTSVAGRQGRCIGVIPSENGVPKDGYPNPFVEIPIYTPLGVFDPHAPDAPNRNWVNIMTSDVIIALPGKQGTINEVNLALKFNKPLHLFGPADTFVDFPTGLPQTDNLETVLKWLEPRLA